MKPTIHYLPDYLLSNVHPLTINLIGCGGSGSHLLSQLARIDQTLRSLEKTGLTVRAFDPDHVSHSNLGRQLFTTSDINLNKATVLVNRINRAFGLNWQAFPHAFNQDYCNSKETPGANLTISCVDSAKTRHEINRLISNYFVSEGHNPSRSYYWLDLGNTRSTGQCVFGTTSSVTQPNSTNYQPLANLPTIIDKYPNLKSQDTDEMQGPSCSLAQALNKQDLFINSLLAQYAGTLLWNLLNKGFTVESGVFVNLENYRSSPILI